MNSAAAFPCPLRWFHGMLLAAGAVLCFHVAYSSVPFTPLRWSIAGYLACLVQLGRLKTTRLSFYTGLGTGFLCVAPQLECFWRIFGPAAIPLWLILAFWTAAFVALTHVTLTRLGPLWAVVLLPFVWTGLEYFRSELYFLKFSWLNVGYAFAGSQVVPLHRPGMYGVGFLVTALSMLFIPGYRRLVLVPVAVLVVLVAVTTSKPGAGAEGAPFQVAGVQMEFPMEQEIPEALDRLLAQHPEADLLVLSEYSLDGPVPQRLKAWCRTHRRHLIVGGKDPAPDGNFYNTAFVVDPQGEIVFRQVKSMPIQFFKDGLPAPRQALWDSPWGKIGICVCYDLSYTRVTDRLIRMGAQMLVVPTMDVAEWGGRQHELHGLVAPVRAAEYGIPVFRLASSGISQAIESNGAILARATFPGEGEALSAGFRLSNSGSLPADRLLGPVSVGVTVVLLVVLLCARRAKQPPASVAEPGASAEPTETGVMPVSHGK